MELVPIKIAINLRPRTFASYPDLDQLAVVKTAATDWARYVMLNGGGWYFGSPNRLGYEILLLGNLDVMPYGYILVPGIFADQAIIAFPDDISILSEQEWADHYNQFVHRYEPDTFEDFVIVKEIRTKIDGGGLATMQERQALDPDDSTPGRLRNRRKTWAMVAADNAITIRP